ncbi:uncharacterized protein B0T23DRAFT_283119, partial [Neurospora hispaniola]
AQFGVTPTGLDELFEHTPPCCITETNIQSPIHLANVATDSAPIRHIAGSISPDSGIDSRLPADSLHHANNYTGSSATLSDWELSLFNRLSQAGEVAVVPSQSTLSERIAFSTIGRALSRDNSQLIAPDAVIGGSQPRDSEVYLPFPSLPPGGWDEQGNPIFYGIPNRSEPSLPEPARSELDNEELIAEDPLAFDEWVSDEQVAPDTAVLPPSLSRFELQQPRLAVPQPHFAEQGHSNPTPREPAPDLFAADEVLADFSFFDIFGEPGPAGLASTTPAIAERAEVASPKRATP